MRLILRPGVAADCYATEQERYVDYFAKGYADLPAAIKGIIISETTPGPDFQTDWAWGRLVGGNPDRIYLFSTTYGMWAAKHWFELVGGVIMWEGDISTVATVDGGTAGPVTDVSGPFWEALTAMIGRSPMYPGAIPTSNPAKTLAVTEPFGEGAHVQTVAELATHSHVVKLDGGGNDGSAKVWTAISDNGVELSVTSEPTGSSTPMNVTHPVYGIYFLRRTARRFYTAT